jgi:DNA-binding GntR family transcriptional regulator
MLQPVALAPNLIDQAYQHLLAAIADGTLAPGQRIRQAELAETMGVSRQPISHALHLLKRQGLVEESGRKGLRVVPLDPARIPPLYQVREVVDGLAARLLAGLVASGDMAAERLAPLRAQVGAGLRFDAATAVPVLVRADTAFHRTLYELAGNTVIGEMMAPLWPHLMRSMAAVLRTPDEPARVWAEHAAILRAVEAGDAAAAERAARTHAEAAASRTAARLLDTPHAA